VITAFARPSEIRRPVGFPMNGVSSMRSEIGRTLPRMKTKTAETNGIRAVIHRSSKVFPATDGRQQLGNVVLCGHGSFHIVSRVISSP